MPNVVAALPNMMLPCAERRKVWLTPTTRVLCSSDVIFPEKYFSGNFWENFRKFPSIGKIWCWMKGKVSSPKNPTNYPQTFSFGITL